MAQNQNEKFQVVSTKLSNDSYELLVKLCARKGLTIYEFLQMVCDTLIRYMDDRHNMTPEMEQAMSIFDHMQRWKEGEKETLNICDPTAKPSVHEATYYFSQDGRLGCRAVHTQLPYMNQEVATYNIQEILERTLCLLVPDRYKRMRQNAASHGTSSILSYIDKLLNRDDREDDLRELRAPFMDCRRTKYGGKDLEQVYVQHKARGFDNMADRRKILGEEPDLWAAIEGGTDNTDDDGTQQGICPTDELGTMADDEEAAAE